ncbi:hypothetical protein BDU57DRAFT_520304 [Ampelomyces quisqualis]|uniref:Uncharacterized protein n=1 Tax=Ampelomyces quisqualis TaxID=50730 RepID=A0A6A5QI19_AMPQU|nr:hypothetical protein BDU57DRAFT_520304 [Ampelomyces quisqualis]
MPIWMPTWVQTSLATRKGGCVEDHCRIRGIKSNAWGWELETIWIAGSRMRRDLDPWRSPLNFGSNFRHSVIWIHSFRDMTCRSILFLVHRPQMPKYLTLSSRHLNAINRRLRSLNGTTSLRASACRLRLVLYDCSTWTIGYAETFCLRTIERGPTITAADISMRPS